MSQPASYTPQTNFNDDENNAVGGRSTVKTASLDTEFDNLNTTLDQILVNLALLQRDDGKIKDGLCEPHGFGLSSSSNGFLKWSGTAWSFVVDPTNSAATAQAAAEVAQAAAEAARDLAETHKNNAETAKLAAETAQAAAELAAGTIPAPGTIKDGVYWAYTTTGSANAYTATTAPAITSYTFGQFLLLKIHAANTGAATIDVDGIGVKNIKKMSAGILVELESGDLPLNVIVQLVYDGTQFQLLGGMGVSTSDQTSVNRSNIMRAFEEIQENHGGSLLMEAGWSDTFGNANEQGADESNSSGEQHDNTNKLYKGTDAGTGLNSDKDYTTESNYLQQEWTNSLIGSSQVTVTGGTTATITGTWPANCANGRISFDAGSTWFDIASRDSATVLTLASSATNATTDFIIRMSEFESGSVKLNSAGDNNTNSLLHFDGSDASTTITDSGNTGHAFTAYGNAQLDTAQSKIGSASLLLDGTGDYIQTDSSSSEFNLGTEDFTIEFWYRSPNPAHSNGSVVAMGTAGAFYNDDLTVDYDGTGDTIRVYFGHPSLTNATYAWATVGTMSADTWYHYAFTRTGSTLEFYLDGTSKGTKTCLSDFGSFVTPKLRLGSRMDGTSSVHGHVDEFRYSKGVRRYTTNFTPPTTAFSAGSSLANERVSICDTEVQKTNTSAWSDINSASITEAPNSQSLDYWFIFDPASSFGAGTEIKIFNQTGSVWRTVAVNTGGTWQYNNNASHDATQTLANSTVNDMLHAVSQAISTQAANRMDKTDIEAITDGEWEAANGWSTSVDSIIRGVTLYSSSTSQNPSVSQYRLNYDSARASMDLRSKTYDPGFVPVEGYLWCRAEHSDIDGPGTFYVSRNGGTAWSIITMTQQGEPLAGNEKILRGTVDVTGQTSGQDLRCRYVTTQGKDQYLHSWGLQAKS